MIGPVLIGREDERERLRAVLDDAREGRGGAIVIRGEPGIGKTALLEDLRAAADGFCVLSARGVESESHLAFAGLADVLRPVLDRRADLPHAQRVALEAALALGPPGVPDRFAAYAATFGLIGAVAAETPVMIALDDAHWLDRPTQETLLFSARRLADDPVAIVATSREIPHEDLDVSDIREVRLGPLGRDEARRLLEAAGEALPREVADAIIEAAGGNPLALVELAAGLSPAERAGTALLPRSLRAGDVLARTYRSRFERLPPGARRAALLTSLSEDGALGALMPALAAGGGGRADLATAEEAGFVALTDDAAHMRHPLLRSVVLAFVTPAERRAAHVDLAGAVDPRNALEQRAWHLAEAALGPDEVAASALEQAAMMAAARTGYATAASALERAARLTQDLEAADDRRLGAAQMAMMAGRPALALRLADEVTAPSRRPRAEQAIGRSLMWVGPVDHAYRSLIDGAAQIEGEHPRLAAEMLVDAAATRGIAGDCGANLDVARRAIVAARRSRDPEILGTAEAMLGTGLLLRGHRHEAVEYLAPWAARAAELDPLSPEYQFALFSAHSWLVADHIATSERTVERLVSSARRAGALALLPYALTIRVDIEHRVGRWAEARASADEALALVRELGSPVFESRGFMVSAMVRMAAGETERGVADAEAAIELGLTHGVGSMVTSARWVLGFGALADGDLDRAVSWLEQVEHELQEIHGLREPAVIMWQPDLVEAYVRIGRIGDARRVLATLSEQAHRTGGTWALAVTSRCRGLIDDDADRHFGEALALHEGVPMPFERARTELAYGSRLRRAGRRTEARAQLERALATFDELGARPWSRQAREEIAAGGARLRPRSGGRPGDELTARELQVALAVAEGATNREAAARLFLSEKTIERHLGSVYRKLGLRSRTELARRLAAGAAQAGTADLSGGARVSSSESQ